MNLNGELIKGHIGNVVVDSIKSKNLLNVNAIYTTNTTNWSISFSNNVLSIQHKTSSTDGVPTLSLGKLGAGTYVLSGTISGGHIAAVGYYKNGTYQTMLYNNSTFTITDNDSVEFVFSNSSISTTTYTNLQLEKGSSATTYAPYQNLNNDIQRYFLNEKEIGVWTNGKPIYRKCYKGTSTVDSNGYFVIVDSSLKTVDEVLRYDFFIKVDTVIVPIPNVGDRISSKYLQLSYGGIGTVIQNSAYYSDFNNKPYTIILEYTKTTD